ncbi:hypothetical protein TREMEDRAFT_28982 [Tremella mesenterica DSM 1558]|uniref:uncharacterized protein n=1 Tax=Tremella mesenterica (strain ATCC 24925 / CBS 8224 / DSM 1558 / NBRC 9311 / NRRL Y-6157 / RJB 2259-6 / UBC 559-6) TaxID=578456 RepID=UPI0003F49AF5|nr:uncharacterized protein TREMEDRAFT_28982 [Tremella mesenterica DSM 1558]EIW70416.1 hypothetical protein TREMEDRAFT_28982 [Tremella mesenterica DSM 1558]
MDPTRHKIRADTNETSIPLAPAFIPSYPPSPTPTPLDLSISYALSDSCLMYLGTLLSSAEFLTCLPFSLLLTSSSSYSSMLSDAMSTGNYTYLNALVGYTHSPQPSGEQCDAYMAGVASALTGKGNCLSDIRMGKAVALEILVGIGNYALLRKAEGLLDSSGRFCYLDAVADGRPDDLYLWNLPAGIALPSTSRPTCSACSAQLLNLYTSSLSSTPTLNSTIVNSAVQSVNSACGSTFVSYSATSAASPSRRMWNLWLGTVLCGIWSIWTLL